MAVVVAAAAVAVLGGMSRAAGRCGNGRRGVTCSGPGRAENGRVIERQLIPSVQQLASPSTW
eukprot:366369-Pleurochrysis_carterae.AAC.1